MQPDPIQWNVWSALANLLAGAAFVGCVSAWVWALVRAARRKPLIEPPPQSLPLAGSRGWNGSTAVLVVGAFFLVQFGVAVLFYAGVLTVTRSRAALENLEMSPRLAMILTTIANLFLMLLLPLIIRAVAGIDLAGLGLRPARALSRNAWRGFVAFFLVSPIVYLTFYLAQTIWKRQEHPVFNTIEQQGAAASAALAILSAVVTAPIVEELVFRGALLGWLTRWAQRRAAALGSTTGGRQVSGGYFDSEGVLVLEYDTTAPDANQPETLAAPPAVQWIPNISVSLLFASIHSAQWPAPIPLFLLSLALGWLAQRTRGLAAPIALHITFNGLATLVALLATQGGIKPPA